MFSPQAIARARTIRAELTDRLQDPAIRGAAWDSLAQHTSAPHPHGQSGPSLAEGCAGIAIALATEGKDAGAVHQLMREAIQGLQYLAGEDLSLFQGVGGLLAAIDLVGCGRPGYRTAQRTLTEIMCAHVDAACDIADELAATGHGMDPSVYDLVSGLAGWTAVLSLTRDPAAEQGVRRLQETLTRLLRRTEGVFPLYTGPVFMPEEARMRAPAGHVDCGVAHGVSGVAGLLAVVAPANGRPSSDLRAVLADVAAWLTDLIAPGPAGPLPPARLGLRGERALPTRPEDVPAAWCYGVAGMARAVWLAGRAIGDRRFMDSAVQALRDCHMPSRHRLREPTLCHGVAGLLLIMWLMARESGDPDLRRGAASLLDQLLDHYDTSSLLGFRTMSVGRVVDDPGFLTGTAGIVALLNALLSDRPPAWGRLLAVC
ncbi:lanthionine synthetase C family protein [Microtetraspora malaysiensis]|uniref:lanthionine synthetase C family protein n=1 Tax=Microtetraspora malaysiensis TaxID=161358 RepID=UPI0008317D59|nr:lanthionine synthetase C family protein [Microtetraspora malaysiensis]